MGSTFRALALTDKTLAKQFARSSTFLATTFEVSASTYSFYR